MKKQIKRNKFNDLFNMAMSIKKEEVKNQGSTYEVNIYVETAHDIFQKCLLKAKLRDERHMPARLSEAIAKELNGISLEAKYLRNVFNKIKKLKTSKDHYQEIVFYYDNLLILANYAGVADYMALNKKFGPNYYIPVLYTACPFSLFDLIRVPDQGRLKQIGNAWELEFNNNLTIKGNAEAVNPFTMPGDRRPFWIELKYDDGRQTAYFAEDLNPSVQPVSESDRLLLFLRKLVISNKDFSNG